MSLSLLRVVLVLCACFSVALAAPSRSAGVLEPMGAPQSNLPSDGTVLTSLSSSVAVGITLEDGGQVVEVVDPKTKVKRTVLQYPAEVEPFNLLLCCVWKTPKSKFDGRTIADCSRIDCVKQSKRVSELSAAAAMPVDSSNTELLHLLEAQQERVAAQRDIDAAALKQKLMQKPTPQPVLRTLNVNTLKTNTIVTNKLQPSQNIIRTGPVAAAAAAAARRLLNEHGEDTELDSSAAEEQDTELLETVATESTGTPFQGHTAWMRGNVYWEWDASFAAASQGRRDRLLASYTQAMNDWSQNTCIQWWKQTDAAAPPNPHGAYTALGVVFEGNSHTDGIGADYAADIRKCVIRVDWGILRDVYRPDCHHELGHVLGLEHTMKRRDYANFVTTHLNIGGACADDWCLADSIKATKKVSAYVEAELLALHPNTPGFAANVNAIVNNPVPGGLSVDDARSYGFKRDALINMKAKPRYQGRASRVTNFLTNAGPIGEGFTEDDVRTALAYAEAAHGMEYQYRPIMDITLTSVYDFRSIMHYYLGNCMTANVVTPVFAGNAAVGSPGAISALDADAICQMYSCGIYVRASGSSPAAAVGGAATPWTFDHFFHRSKTLGEIRTFIADFVRDNPNRGLPQPVTSQYELLASAPLLTHIRTGHVRARISTTVLADDTAVLGTIATTEANANANPLVPATVRNQNDIAAGRGDFEIEFY